MPQGNGRVWAGRLGAAAAVLLVAGGGLVAWQWPAIRVRYAGHRLRTAATDEDRAARAAELAGLGDDGFAALADALRGGDTAVAAAVADAIRQRLASDTTAAGRAFPLLGPVNEYPPAGRAAALALVPDFLRTGDPAAAELGKAAVRAGLTAADAESRAVAARLAINPSVGLAAEAVALRTDPDPGVRAAAVTAAGAPGGDGTVGDEELFRFLHDPDAGVREACRAVLAAHGRTPEEVALGRRLTDPRPAERLRLLLDLAADTGRDVGPWLERLSRDPEPAVRAGAARVAAEVGLPFAAWLDQLAASDPDPLVRQVARYHKGRSSGLTPVGGP